MVKNLAELHLKGGVILEQVIKSEGLIYMVLEYGDIDLARLLQRHEAAQKEGGCTELDENFIRLYWQQMLQASMMCARAACSLSFGRPDAAYFAGCDAYTRSPRDSSGLSL